MGRRSRETDTIIIVAAVIAGLYFGREVLVPIALAVLLSFVLAPVVVGLRRLHVGKVASVVLSVFVAFGLLIGIGTIIGKQVSQLSENLPQYQAIIAKKLETVRRSDFNRGVVEKAADALKGLDGKLNKAPEAAKGVPSPTDVTVQSNQPLLPVEVHEPAPGPVQILQSILAALLPPLATTAASRAMCLGSSY